MHQSFFHYPAQNLRMQENRKREMEDYEEKCKNIADRSKGVEGIRTTCLAGKDIKLFCLRRFDSSSKNPHDLLAAGAELNRDSSGLCD